MLRKALTPIESDTEDAPWMVMGTPQSRMADAFFSSVWHEFSSRPGPLFVAMFLPIRWHPVPGEEVEVLAPDILVARVSDYDRSSYSLDREGSPPAFVLEVLSPESWERDVRVKPERYEVMGVEEYALFAPVTAEGRVLLEPALQGYRRHPVTGEFVRWEPDEHGRLWSEVLGLWIAVRDGALRAQRADGSWVATLPEATAALRQEAEARRQVEAELARLRAEMERQQQNG